MNIGIDIRSLMDPQRTGVGEYTQEFLNALFRLDTENQYFLFYNAWKDVLETIPKWTGENIHVVHTKIPNKFFNGSLFLFGRPKLDRLPGVRKKLGKKRLDVFFSPNIHFTPLSKKTTYILTIHDLSFEHFPACYSWKRRLWHRAVRPRRQAARADVILAPSESTKLDIIQTYGVDPKKVRVVGPGLASDFTHESALSQKEVRQRYGLPEKFILFLGTIEPRKNLLGLLDAFARSTQLRALGYELVLAGASGWKSRTIMEAVERTPGVRYVGYIDRQDKAALYALADLFVYPSLYEGFGFPVLESMVAGTPVVTSNRSSLGEVAGDAAYYVDPMNTDDIARAMERLLGNTELRNMCIERGLTRVKKFHWRTAAEQFLSILSE